MKNNMLRFYIGLTDKDDLNKTYDSRKAIDIISMHYDGFTVIYGVGSWKGQIANTLIIEIIEELAKNACLDELIKELNQESILVTNIPLKDVIFY